MSDTIEGFTECSHRWRGAHCIRDNEGSCPFEYDRDNPQADCRCKESRWVVVRIPVVDEAMIERVDAVLARWFNLEVELVGGSGPEDIC